MDAEPILLLVEGKGGAREIYPITAAALTRAQGSKREIRRKSIGARVVLRDGRVRIIQDVHFVRLYGASLAGKLLSALNGDWEVEFHYRDPAQPTLPELKELIIQYLTHDSQLGEPNLPQPAPLDQVVASVRGAPTFSEVVASLHLPSPEDCLDIL